MKVKGKVFDEADYGKIDPYKDSGIPGANVYIIKDNKISKLVNADDTGLFNIEADQGDTINVSYTGYLKTTFTANTGNNFIYLKPNPETNLQDVVVTATKTYKKLFLFLGALALLLLLSKKGKRG